MSLARLLCGRKCHFSCVFSAVLATPLSSTMHAKGVAVIEKVHNHIVETLSAIGGVSVDRYYGQLSDPKDPDIQKEELPKILVDFVGDEREGSNRALYFNLYFVHIAYSANESYRQQTNATISKMMEEVEKRLDKVTRFFVRTNRSRKLFDAAIDEGYLSLFSRSITAYTTDEGVYEWTA